MTDPTQQAADSVTGATVTADAEKTIGQVAHEAAVAAGAAEGEWHDIEAEIKADLEKFGKIIEAVVHHIFSKPVTVTPAAAVASTPAAKE